MVLFARYLSFVRAVSTGGVGRAGVVLTTSAFACMVVLEVGRLIGLLTNAYLGLITYLALPALFVFGLLLIPIGWRSLKRRTGKTADQLISEQIESGRTDGGLLGSRTARLIAILSMVNVVFLVGISSRMLGFMDTAEFCGTACHSVMNPEWTTYQQSSHARVACVECHVGEGAAALVDSKMNGLWQMVSVTFDLLERPIPTPVHQLRPARETCEKCHWPEKFYGTRLKTIARHQRDSLSTPLYTTLSMKVDDGHGESRRGIHWHIAAENEVRYASADDKREDILWAEVRQPDGSFRRYAKAGAPADIDPGSVRSMDCVDCHNRATHVYEDPERAIDDRIRRGLMSRSLPFLKREALQAITGSYSGREAALEGIANHLNGFYQRHYPDLARGKAFLIDSAVIALQGIYERNVHPEMKIEWGAYRSHIGHLGDGGCFRCHNSKLIDESGATISSDCALCHSMLANGHDDQFHFLKPADTAAIDYHMHRYLQEEFLQSSAN